MNLKILMMLAIFVTIVMITAEASLLVSHSLLRPRYSERHCFTSRPEDRPLMYPLIKFFSKMKDRFVKAFNVIVAHAKDNKLV